MSLYAYILLLDNNISLYIKSVLALMFLGVSEISISMRFTYMEQVFYPSKYVY